MPSNGNASGIASSGAMYVVDRGFNSPNRKCSIQDFALARLRGCPGKPGAGNPHAGFYLGGEVQGQPRLLPTDHAIDHAWLVKFIEHRIGDQRVVRHMQKWLHAGVLEDGQWHAQEAGTPQGGSVSRLAANIYLPYVLDLWADRWRRQYARGEVIIVRYCDDFIVG